MGAHTSSSCSTIATYEPAKYERPTPNRCRDRFTFSAGGPILSYWYLLTVLYCVCLLLLYCIVQCMLDWREPRETTTEASSLSESSWALILRHLAVLSPPTSLRSMSAQLPTVLELGQFFGFHTVPYPRPISPHTPPQELF